MKNPPNLLFIFSDQHTAGITGFSGDPIAETPALDGLAKRGVWFANAYCPSPLCTPSRMSMMTGRHPYRNHVWGNEDVLHSGIPTMAHALGAAGCDPVLIGRLHSVGPDQLLGYSRREIGDHHPNWAGLGRLSMGPLEGAASPDRRSLRQSGHGQSAYEVKDEDVINRALDELETIAGDLKAGRRDRFSMTVGLMLPHAPFVARKADFDHFIGKVGPAKIRSRAVDEEHPWIAEWRRTRGIADVSEEEEIKARTAYYALVRSMDRMIGKLLEKLDALNLTEDTLVVYSSDHGEQLGEHGMWWKHTFHEASVKVPLIMAWPRILPQGEKRDQVVNLVDLTATMLDAMAAPPLENADGVSFLPVAIDADAPWNNITYSEYCHGPKFDWGISGSSQNRMIRDGDHKLIYYHGMSPQLFDLASDPHELTDLADDPRYAAIRSRLTQKVLNGWDPALIEAEINNKLADKVLLKAWAERAQPASTMVWEMLPHHNRLDS